MPTFPHRALALLATLAAVGPSLADTGTLAPPPRLATPAEQREGSRPDSLRGESTVVPQVQLALTRAAGSADLDDSAAMTLNRRLARCEVIIEPLSRMDCKRREEGLPPAPPRAIGAERGYWK